MGESSVAGSPRSNSVGKQNAFVDLEERVVNPIRKTAKALRRKAMAFVKSPGLCLIEKTARRRSLCWMRGSNYAK